MKNLLKIIVLFALISCVICKGGGGRSSGRTSGGSKSGGASSSSSRSSGGGYYYGATGVNRQRNIENDRKKSNLLNIQATSIGVTSNNNNPILHQIFRDEPIGGVGNLWFGQLEQINSTDIDSIVPFSIAFYPDVYDKKRELITEKGKLGQTRFIDPIEVVQQKATKFVVQNIDKFWWAQLEFAVMNGKAYDRVVFQSNEYKEVSIFQNLDEGKFLDRAINYIKVVGMTNSHVAQEYEQFRIPDLQSSSSSFKANIIFTTLVVILVCVLI